MNRNWSISNGYLHVHCIFHVLCMINFKCRLWLLSIDFISFLGLLSHWTDNAPYHLSVYWAFVQQKWVLSCSYHLAFHNSCLLDATSQQPASMGIKAHPKNRKMLAAFTFTSAKEVPVERRLKSSKATTCGYVKQMRVSISIQCKHNTVCRLHTSALMKPRSMSPWMQPAHCGAREPVFRCQLNFYQQHALMFPDCTGKECPAAHFRNSRSEEISQFQVLVAL